MHCYLSHYFALIRVLNNSLSSAISIDHVTFIGISHNRKHQTISHKSRSKQSLTNYNNKTSLHAMLFFSNLSYRINFYSLSHSDINKILKIHATEEKNKSF